MLLSGWAILPELVRGKVEGFGEGRTGSTAEPKPEGFDTNRAGSMVQAGGSMV
jgi:hypothetical protein